MGAAVPNWQKLHSIGRLPAHAKKFIPGLAEFDKAKADFEAAKKVLCADCLEKIQNFDRSLAETEKGLENPARDLSGEMFQQRCDFEGCTFTSSARSESTMKAGITKHKQADHIPIKPNNLGSGE